MKKIKDKIISLNLEALKKHDEGEYEEALSLACGAAMLSYSHFGGKHSDYAISLNNSAEIIESMGDYKMAESLYQESIEILEGYNKKTSLLASFLNNLAGLYKKIKQNKKSESLYLEAIEIMKIMPDNKENLQDYLLILKNLEELYVIMGNFDKADNIEKQEFELREKIK